MLLEELHGEQRLRRVLGPVELASLGIGALIGTGIFVLVGVAAHDRTGPALMLSFVAAGLTCIFVALWYAEFASMVPVAASAVARLCPTRSTRQGCRGRNCSSPWARLPESRQFCSL